MTATTLTLADFILARVEEEEDAAWAIRDPEGGWWVSKSRRRIVRSARLSMALVAESPDVRIAAHIARHDPARVLAECEAKRAIVEQFRPGRIVMQDSRGNRAQTDEMDDPRGVDVLRALASVYADHPDFDPAWGA